MRRAARLIAELEAQGVGLLALEAAGGRFTALANAPTYPGAQVLVGSAVDRMGFELLERGAELGGLWAEGVPWPWCEHYAPDSGG